MPHRSPRTAAGGPTAHVPYLDGWRGLAIALVLQSHFFDVPGIDTARLGVDVFFCLSGYLMAGLLFVQRQPLRQFYKRRISRIIPAFVVFVIAAFGVGIWLDKPFTTTEVISTLLFARTYVPAAPDIWSSGVAVHHLWSLNVEEHSYIFMSLLTLVAATHLRAAGLLLGAGMAAVAIGLLYVKLGLTGLRWQLGSETIASHLLLAAGYRVLRERFAVRGPALLAPAALGAAGLCYLDSAPWWAIQALSPPLFAVAINHLSQAPASMHRILSSAPARQLGIWSYSLYLWQQPFDLYMARIPGGFLVAFVLAMLVGILSYFVIERPSRRWLNEHW